MPTCFCRFAGTQSTEIRGGGFQPRDLHTDTPRIGDSGDPAGSREAGIHDRRCPSRIGARCTESDRVASDAVAASGGDCAGPGDRAGQGIEGEQHRRALAS